MATSSDSSENWLITMDRMFLSSDDSGIGRHIGGPFSDAGDDRIDRGPMKIKACRSGGSLRPEKCARIAAKNAICFFCNAGASEGEYVVHFRCGHWIQRSCYHAWRAGSHRVKCPYDCAKDKRNVRSSELMPEEYDVDEDDLTDAEDLLERHNELGKSVAATSHTRSPSNTRPDTDIVYEGDVEDVGELHHASTARRRRNVEKGLAQSSAEQQPQAVPEEEPGHFFPEIPEDEEDFGMNSELTLAQRMFNPATSKRKL